VLVHHGLRAAGKELGSLLAPAAILVSATLPLARRVEVIIIAA
jgi:hypothetical protein